MSWLVCGLICRYRRKRPSRDQSRGNFGCSDRSNGVSVPWLLTSFSYRSKLPLRVEVQTMRWPSGDHRPSRSLPGSKGISPGCRQADLSATDRCCWWPNLCAPPLFDIRSTREFYETSATDRREKHDVQQRTSGAALGHSSSGGDDETTFARVDPVRGAYVRLAGIWCFRCVARGPADVQVHPAVNHRDHWRPIERPALDGRQR